nr:branched-chain alpha-keto acid dehydrogenase subunit E2 [SAR324 cluster bacterium]
MARIEDILVPDIGEFDAVEVIEVLVKSGDIVSAEDPLLTMESDKASMDVPSPFGGTVKTVKIKAGDRVSQNDLILTMMVVEESANVAPETVAKTTLSVEGDETSSLEKTANESSIPETSLDATSSKK